MSNKRPRDNLPPLLDNGDATLNPAILKKLPKIFDGEYFAVLDYDEKTKKITARCVCCSAKSVSIRGQSTSTGNFYKHYMKAHSNLVDDVKKYCDEKVNAVTTKGKPDKQSILPFSKKLDPIIVSLLFLYSYYENCNFFSNFEYFRFFKVRSLILQFILATKSPFSIVENDDFLNLIAYISDEKAKVPTAKTLITDLSDEYERMKKSLIDMIDKAKFVCITADIWTNKARSFIGSTIHFFDDNLDRKSYLLAFRRIYGRHTHDVIAEMLLSIQREFRINRSKVTHIITDGGSNFVKAFVIFGPPANSHESIQENSNESEEITPEFEAILTDGDEMFFPPETINEQLNLNTAQSDEEYDEASDDFSILPKQMRCTAHLLNLIGTSDFEKELKRSSIRSYDVLNSAYSKLKRFWEMNSRSTTVHEVVQRVCERSFPYPNATRWNSKFDSIAVAEKHRLVIKEAIDEINKEVLRNAPRNNKNKKLEQLSVVEWRVLKDYTSCLQPVAIALDILQGEKRACQGYILPTLYSIRATLEENMEKNIYVSDHGLVLHECILECLNHRFANLMAINEDNKELILAAAVHSNFKLTWIDNESDRECAQNMLINSYIELSKLNGTPEKSNGSSELETTENAENSFFKRLRVGERRTSSDDTLTFDVYKYLLQTINDPNLHQIKSMPLLEEMFRKYNTSLSSSAPVERIFSMALLIFTSRRNRISDQNFEKSLFVYKNRELILNRLLK